MRRPESTPKCADCLSPPCSSMDCPTYKKCRNPACKNADGTCEKQFHVLHTESIPKSKEDVEKFLCRYCRSAGKEMLCIICLQLLPVDVFSKKMQWQPSTPKSMECLSPPCSKGDCPTCKTCRNPACKNADGTCEMPLHVLNTQLIPKTKDDVEIFLCVSCRSKAKGLVVRKCTECRAEKKLTEFTLKASRNYNTRCPACEYPSCSSCKYKHPRDRKAILERHMIAGLWFCGRIKQCVDAETVARATSKK